MAHVVPTCTNGVSPNNLLWLWPVTDHEPHCRHVPINKIWKWTESTQQSGWWCRHMAEIYSECSSREIIINSHGQLSLIYISAERLPHSNAFHCLYNSLLPRDRSSQMLDPQSLRLRSRWSTLIEQFLFTMSKRVHLIQCHWQIINHFRTNQGLWTTRDKTTTVNTDIAIVVCDLPHTLFFISHCTTSCTCTLTNKHTWPF